MRPDVRRDPDTLDRAANRLREVAGELRAGAADPDLAGHTGLAEHGAAARRLADELDALAGTAARTAAGTREADLTAAQRLRPAP